MSWTRKEIAIIVTATAVGLVVVLVVGVNLAASVVKRVLPSYEAVAETSQRLTDTDMQFPEIDCTPVEWRGDITRQKRYAEGVMACLDEMWSPAVDGELRGGNLVTPHVDMRLEGDDAPILCGEGADVYGISFYCPRNQTIRIWTYDSFNELDLVRVATHEYGHHLQEAMGIESQLSSLAAWENDHREVMLMTKRLEAQAECLSGVSANHILPYLAELSVQEDDINIPGEDPEDTHPSQANNRMWFNRGMQEGLSSCDTWSAPQSEIQ
ncbi:MAG: neutral zinc metallopeptidase [Rhodococcus sp. (in: high G+C Gram-positive bacteria)]|uniref:neutral zinc metallopeptidase n=1 Tax=Rhodococcus sp. TaxID=1831 RepID=UPI002AD8D8B1|nr:neutral zinc metallopeptidase [Rhodococcus sp. (in: high G+C Gram-positive bacteria)]